VTACMHAVADRKHSVLLMVSALFVTDASMIAGPACTGVTCLVDCLDCAGCRGGKSLVS